MNEDLAFAIKHNNMDDVKRIALMEGKKINKKNNKSLNALFFAIEYNKIEVVRFLLTLPDLNIEIKNRDNETALALSVARENSEIIRLLINAGANLDILDYKNGNMLLSSARNSECFEEMLNHNLDLHHVNDLNDTPFIYLYRTDNFKALQKLVNHAVSLEDIDKFNEQRKTIFNHRSKIDYDDAIKADKISIEILEKARLKFILENILPEKVIKKNKKL